MKIIKRTTLLFSVLLLLSLFQGCTFFKPYQTPITQGTVINHEELSYLQAGLTMKQVQELLGPPFGRNPFDPRIWEYVFYTTDESFHPDAVPHLLVKFDEELYLKSWEILDKQVVIDRSLF